MQSADVATADEKLRSVATFVLFLLIVAAVVVLLAGLPMKNQTENVFKDRALDRKTIEKRIDFEPIKSQEAREQIMRTE